MSNMSEMHQFVYELYKRKVDSLVAAHGVSFIPLPFLFFYYFSMPFHPFLTRIVQMGKSCPKQRCCVPDVQGVRFHSKSDVFCSKSILSFFSSCNLINLEIGPSFSKSALQRLEKDKNCVFLNLLLITYTLFH